MGLNRHHIEMLAREHLYRPLRGDVLTIGRQSVYLSPDELIETLRGIGVDVTGIDLATVELDRSTLNRSVPRDDLVSDRAIFASLGETRVRAVDVNGYEGAEIVHDLNVPVPASLHAIADVIVDGSTLDNTFDVAAALRNYSEMLRPGGRLFTANIFSAHHSSYTLTPPLTLLDYFVVNGFADCQAYVVVRDREGGRRNVFLIDLDFYRERRQDMGCFGSLYPMAAFVFAEKGEASTVHKTPIQHYYRSDADWESFCRNLDVMRSSRRPLLMRSTDPLFVEDVKDGHLYVDDQFRAVR
jgi:SAM-dependent methyltransferase